MRKKIISVAVHVVKYLLLILLLNLLLSNYNAAHSFYKQPWWMWIGVYVPCLIGYEYLISIIINKFSNNKK
jgi:uncharacterized membrane protein YdcZ (DUF606 family)